MKERESGRRVGEREWERVGEWERERVGEWERERESGRSGKVGEREKTNL